MNLKIFCLILFFLFIPITHASIIINEIMYNPEGNDNNHEWVELYNNGTEDVNLTDWIFQTDSSNHELKVPPENGGQGDMVISPDGYVIIAQNATVFLNDYTNFTSTVIDSSWPDLLNSQNETLILKNSINSVIDNITYQPIASEGFTICNISGTFSECYPTPGYENKVPLVDTTLYVNLDNIILLNNLHDSLFRIEMLNKTNCTNLDNVTVNYTITNLSDSKLVEESSFTQPIGCNLNENTGEWLPDNTGTFRLCGNITNATSNNDIVNDFVCMDITVIDPASIPCDLSLEITTSKLIYENESIKYTIFVNDENCSNINHPITIKHWAEDLFGNVIEDYVTIPGSTTPCDENISKTWTPSHIIGSEGYQIKANITYTGCNDTNHTNNFYSRAILFKGYGYPQESTIRIVDVNSGETAKYGEIVSVKTEIYKNSTNKYAVYAWVENSEGIKLSETTIVHIKSKNTLYNFTIPVQLKHNCDERYEDGNHIVVVEGLGLNVTDNININGVSSSVCSVEYISSESSSSSSCYCPSTSDCSCPIKAPDYEILAYKDEIHEGEEFDTKIKLTTKSYKNISVYSYVYEGNKILSLGFDGNKWLATWTANKQNIEINNTSIILTLKNKIREGTELGLYTLRVRVNDGKKYDIDREIQIKKEEIEKNETLQNITQNITIQNVTIEMKTEEETENLITAFVAENKSNYIVRPDPTRIAIYLIYIKHLLSKSQA